MKVLYSGSFNPFHIGHQYVYNIACRCFGKDNVWLGVGINKDKKVDLEGVKFSLRPITDKVIWYQGLTADAVKENGFDMLIRGIRPGRSLEHEEDLMYWNRRLADVDTILVPTPPEINQISSSVIRELARYNADVKEFMNDDVYYRWKQGRPNTTIYFGRTCSGKSTYVGKQALDMDKAIWDLADVSKLMREQAREAFYSKNKKDYDEVIRFFAMRVDWRKLFVDNAFIDMPVLGVYWKYIPLEIRAMAALVKISTSDFNRRIFAEKRKVDPRLLECADHFYQDPPYWDYDIEIEDHSNIEIGG